MKIAYVLAAGILVASVSSASAVTEPYDGSTDIMNPVLELYSTVMTQEVSQPLTDGEEETPIAVPVVPVPAAGFLLLAGIAGLAALRRKA